MSATETEETRPVCRYASTIGEHNEWEKKPLTDRLTTWHPPCKDDECFPDGEIDTDEVVRKKKRGSTPQSLHRPA